MKVRLDRLIPVLLCLSIAFGAFTLCEAASTEVPCSTEGLIAAINEANASGSAQTLNLAPNCLYSLTAAVDKPGDRGSNGLPPISGNLTITGNNTTIERSAQRDTPMFRMLQVNEEASLALHGVTLRNGHNDETNEEEEGGAIFNRGNLEVTNCTILNNLAGCGGAIYSYNTLRVADTAFVSNVANM